MSLEPSNIILNYYTTIVETPFHSITVPTGGEMDEVTRGRRRDYDRNRESTIDVRPPMNILIECAFQGKINQPNVILEWPNRHRQQFYQSTQLYICQPTFGQQVAGSVISHDAELVIRNVPITTSSIGDKPIYVVFLLAKRKGNVHATSPIDEIISHTESSIVKMTELTLNDYMNSSTQKEILENPDHIIVLVKDVVIPYTQNIKIVDSKATNLELPERAKAVDGSGNAKHRWKEPFLYVKGKTDKDKTGNLTGDENVGYLLQDDNLLQCDMYVEDELDEKKIVYQVPDSMMGSRYINNIAVSIVVTVFMMAFIYSMYYLKDSSNFNMYIIFFVFTIVGITVSFLASDSITIIVIFLVFCLIIIIIWWYIQYMMSQE